MQCQLKLILECHWCLQCLFKFLQCYSTHAFRIKVLEESINLILIHTLVQHLDHIVELSDFHQSIVIIVLYLEH